MGTLAASEAEIHKFHESLDEAERFTRELLEGLKLGTEVAETHSQVQNDLELVAQEFCMLRQSGQQQEEMLSHHLIGGIRDKTGLVKTQCRLLEQVYRAAMNSSQTMPVLEN